MRIRSPLTIFVLIVVLLLVWQMVFILLTVMDLLHPIDARFTDQQPLNETNKKVPQIIHQTWKTNDLSSYPINNSHAKWREYYPDYEIRLWTDEQIARLISEHRYEHLSPIYHSYRYDIQRADLARLIILHSHGGIYADLDVYPNSRRLDALLRRNVSFVIARSSSDNCLVNHFMISERHSSVVEKILRQVSGKRWFEQIYVLPYLEVFSTGSIFVTKVLRDCCRSEERLLILSRDELAEYVSHDAGRSWHLIDGYLINQFDAHPRRFLAFSFVFFLLCLMKFCKLSRVFNKFR